ncbi:HNH endonuclease [Mycobacterium phage Phrappuccino]|uniref:HNH endonuclease n=1 Tax=Mycobacterium phage Phrappuccino TaxID=2591223 RepID=A0A514DDZ4_9CAUD|nr:HNH endonuclease [Mycobacterium phage Phrappuccino]QDH91830.1 HNH endonuclease [Mycobacterium phage Phrappuccino]QIQ63272.1 HNH endonuclease [Mycobacterium phage Settecandela]
MSTSVTSSVKGTLATVHVDADGRVRLGRLHRHRDLSGDYSVQVRPDGTMLWTPLPTEPEDETTWVPVKGFRGYQASDTGFIKRTATGKVLVPRFYGDNPNDGGASVRLRTDEADDPAALSGYGHGFVVRSVAVLVLESFGQPCPGDGYAPYRRDRDKTNNALANLYWDRVGRTYTWKSIRETR